MLVHAAASPDAEGAADGFRIAQRKHQRLAKIIGDSAYTGNGLVEKVKRLFRFVLSMVPRDRKRKGWYVLPKRWIVERTLSWFGRYRWFSKEYAHKTTSSETDVYGASIRMMRYR